MGTISIICEAFRVCSHVEFMVAVLLKVRADTSNPMGCNSSDC